MQRPGLKYTYDKAGILRELLSSAVNNHVLGIFISGEEEHVTTAVSQISEDVADPLVYFKESDLHGYPLQTNPCFLSQIKSVIHFDTRFDDPTYVRIRESRSIEGLAA
jgi:hypothetical protein